MATDELSDMIVLNVQASSANQSNSTPISSQIQLLSSPIVNDMSEWNLYFKSLYLTASELPYFNALRNVAWDADNYEQSNFSCNRTNLAIVLSSVDNTPTFDTTSAIFTDNSSLMFPMGAVNGTKHSQMGCFCRYVSENSILVDPLGNSTGGYNSQNYPRGYWNIHSIPQFLDMINDAISNILDVGGLNIDDIYFSYQADTGLYNLTMTTAIVSNQGVPIFNMYMNAQCERYFDFFRWGFQSQYTDLTNPPQSLAKVGYVGAYSNCMDYKFIPTVSGLINYTETPVAPQQPQWNWLSDNECVSLMIDAHSLIISIPGGDLNNARSQTIPSNETYITSSLLPPNRTVLKIIDINPAVGAGINNATIVSTADILDMPINIPSSQTLQDIQLIFDIMTCDNFIIPLSISGSTGWAGVRFCLKRRVESIITVEKNLKKNRKIINN